MKKVGTILDYITSNGGKEMTEQFYTIANFEIPLEFKELYEEISRRFERTIADAIITTNTKDKQK